MSRTSSTPSGMPRERSLASASGLALERRMLLRADANEQLGMGHAMRMFALAEEMARRGYAPWFASRSLAGAEQRIRDAGFPVIGLKGSPDSEIETIKNLIAGDPTWPGHPPFRFVALDHYLADPDEWLRNSGRLSRRRLAMDDTRSRSLDCELVVNPALGVRQADYEGLVGSATRLLLGPRYALIRSALRGELAGADARQFGAVATVLIAMGGTHATDGSRLAVAAVRRALPAAEIHVIESTTARRSPFGSEPGIHMHTAPDDKVMGSILLSADLAVGAGGVSAYERCLAGLPSVTIELADNQAAMVRGLEQSGAAVAAGQLDDISEPALTEMVVGLAKDQQRRAALSAQARSLVDGRGVHRIANELEGVRFRRPRPDDVQAIWRWRNDPEARANSASQSPIPWATHQRWFEAAIRDRNVLFLIAYNRAGTLGHVRFELRSDGAEVSIVTDPIHRGTVGAVMLRAALGRLRRTHGGMRVIARVRRENAASRRMFESAAFQQRSEGNEMLEYVLHARSAQANGDAA